MFIRCHVPIDSDNNNLPEVSENLSLEETQHSEAVDAGSRDFDNPLYGEAKDPLAESYVILTDGEYTSPGKQL